MFREIKDVTWLSKIPPSRERGTLNIQILKKTLRINLNFSKEREHLVMKMI